MVLGSDIEYPAISASAFYNRKKVPNLDAAADFVASCNVNDVDVVILPPDPDMLTGEEDIDEDHLDSAELPCDVPGRIEVFVKPSNNASEADSTFDSEWDTIDNETLTSKRVKLLCAKQTKSIRHRRKDPSFVHPHWQKISGHYAHWQSISDGASERANIVCENLRNLTPKDIFEKLVDDKIIRHIVDQTDHQKNNHSFSLTTDELKTFLAILFFTGYHSLPRERLYRSLDEDLQVDIVTRCISKVTGGCGAGYVECVQYGQS
nr:unnamed protein product [Callosobruchus chinensis]